PHHPRPTPPFPYTTLFRSEGTHTIDYYSTDKAGNLEAVKHATVRIDTVTPVSSATGGNQVTNNSSFTIPYTVSDASPSSAIAKSAEEHTSELQPLRRLVCP